jgi:hypothetical protein
MPIVLAVGSTFSPDALRVVLLIAAVVAATWTFRRTEFSGTGLARTIVACLLFAVFALGVFVLGHVLDVHKTIATDPFNVRTVVTPQVKQLKPEDQSPKETSSKSRIAPTGAAKISETRPRSPASSEANASGNTSAGSITIQPGSAVSFGQRGGITASQVMINPSIDYIEPEALILTKLESELRSVRTKYRSRTINIEISPEAGSSQRQAIARVLGSQLRAQEMGYFGVGMTYIGNRPNFPVTMVCSEPDAHVADEIIEALSCYMGPIMKEFEQRFSAGRMQLYLYGQPTFKPNGYVVFK